MKTSSPGLEAGGLDPGHEELQGRLVGLEIGGEPALVADRRPEPALGQRPLQRVEDLGPCPQRRREARRAGGDDHELLQVDGVVGVGSAVEDVEHRNREQVGLVAREPGELGDVDVEGDAGLGRGGSGGRQRDAEDRVRPEPRLVRGPVELAQRFVDRGLIGRAGAGQRPGDRVVDVLDGVRDALAEPLGAAVAKLDSLELTGRGAGWDRGATGRAGVEPNVDLDRRIAPRIEDLACPDVIDRAHQRSGRLPGEPFEQVPQRPDYELWLVRQLPVAEPLYVVAARGEA